jgi:hypothetical protein
MSTSINCRRQWSAHVKLLLIAAVALSCAIGSLTYAVNEPAKRDTIQVGQRESTQSAQQDTARRGKARLLSASNNGSATPVNQRLASTTLGSRPPIVESTYRISDDLPNPKLGLSSAKQLELIEFEDVSLAEAMRLFSEQSGLNVITSTEAGKTKVTVFLKNVTPVDALEAMVKANGLFYRIEANSGIVRIATRQEYEKDLSSFREEQTKVFTLLYPNPAGFWRSRAAQSRG